MKKLLFAMSALAALTLLAPTPSSAEYGYMGFFFDMDATVYESAAAPYEIHDMYILLYEHEFTAVKGYEFSFTIEPAANRTITGVSFQGAGPIDVGGVVGNHIVGLAAPLPTTAVTHLATVSVFVLSGDPLEFTLKGSDPNSVFGEVVPAVLLEGDAIRSVGTPAWDEGAGMPGVCAIMNGTGVIASDEASWDEVKSLYR